MGWWDELKDRASEAASQGTGYNPSDGTWKTPAARNYDKFAKEFSPKEAQGATQTEESAKEMGQAQDTAAKQKALREKQVQFADDLTSEGSLDEAFNPYRQQVLRDLADSQRTLGRNLNKRGLAYGGIAKGAAEKQKGLAQEDLASGRVKIRDEAEAKAQDIRNNVTNEGFKIQQTSQQMLNSIYQSALDQYLQRRRAFKAIGQAGGAVLGTYIGGPTGGAAGSYAGGELMD